MEISRTKAEELSFFIIYDSLVKQEMSQEFDIKELISSVSEESFENTDFFIKESVIKTLSHQQEIENLIIPNLKNRIYDRHSLITKAILLFSIASYKFVGGFDKASIIDIAIKFSKKYGDINEYKFINALLDKVLQ